MRNRPSRRAGVATTLALVASTTSLGLLATPSQGAAAPTCGGQMATIVGTAGDNDIDGTSGRDVIVGRGGEDEINGHGGNDVICGNGGADELEGGPGNDRLLGGRGDDELEGGRGNDRLIGGRGHDEADGGRGRDVCSAEETERC